MQKLEKAVGNVKLRIRKCPRQYVSGKGMDVVSRKINSAVLCMMDGSEEILESRVGEVVSEIITS